MGTYIWDSVSCNMLEGQDMEKLKKLEEVTLPDNRNTFFVIINQQTGERREYGVEDLYGEIKLIELHEVAPEDIRSQFNVARNLSLYTWFCYSFHNVSTLKAYSTVEMALRIRLDKPEKDKTSLRKMMREAVDKGLIKDRHVGHIMEQSLDSQSKPFVEVLPDAIAYLRNLDAHGSTAHVPWSVIVLRICADIINQLFDKTEDN